MLRAPWFTQSFVLVLVPIMCFVWMEPKKAHAWKPHMHAATANQALADAVDGHMCMPGLSDQQVPIGQTDLNGAFLDRSGQWRFFNDLVHLGAYVRAGAIGPDAFPDMYFGQTATHVDHSRKPAPEPPPPPPDDPEAQESIDWTREIIGGDMMDTIMAPLTQSTPPWRSIDWGHAVLRNALDHNVEALRQVMGDPNLMMSAPDLRTDVAESGPLARSLYAERQAAIAFAMGYLMHMSGDSYAHAWVNEWTGQPFDLMHGRKSLDDQAPMVSDAMEELTHIALENYVDKRYEPELVGACTPVDAAFTRNIHSICEEGPTDFAPDCSVCNPLRGEPQVPPDVMLSGKCDHCFEGCNPWREVCPMKVNEGLPCAKSEKLDFACKSFEKQCQALPSQEQRDACYGKMNLECADKAFEACCDDLVGALERGGVIDPNSEKYSCENPETRPSEVWKLYDKIRKEREANLARLDDEARQTVEVASPRGCYQGPIKRQKIDESIRVDLGDVAPGLYTDVTGEVGATSDFNSDGQPDLINECMAWNCMLSPGTSNCALSALRAEVPQTTATNGLVCENFEESDFVSNPDPLLRATDIAVPGGFYERTFMARRYGNVSHEGDLGSYSLGGPVVNGMYVGTDILKVVADALSVGLRHPLFYVADKCVIEGPSSPECKLALKVTTLQVIIAAAAMAVFAIATVINAIPFIGSALSAVLFVVGNILAGTVVLMTSGLFPNLGLPLYGMRTRLLEHLRQEWPKVALTSAQAMSKTPCTNTCGQPEGDDCVEHRFFGIQRVIDFANKAYDITQDLQCEKNTQIARLADGHGGPGDVVDLVVGGLPLMVQSYLGCELIDYFYHDKLKNTIRTVLRSTYNQHIIEPLCSVYEFYEGEESTTSVVGNVTVENASEAMKACRTKMNALFQRHDDPRQLTAALQDFVTMLDEGRLTREQKDRIYDAVERILATQGVKVNLRALEGIGNALDCSVAVSPAIGKISTREAVKEALRPALGDRVIDTVDRIDQELGYYEEVARSGFDDLNPIPLDITRFYPAYNTVQTNKLILLGNGKGICTRVLEDCARRGLNGAECARVSPVDCRPRPELVQPLHMPQGGIHALIKLANAKPFPKAFDGAHSRDLLDENPATYLRSFFQEQGLNSGPEHCADLNYNLACEAFYSLDDPDDYCRFLPPLVEHLACFTEHDDELAVEPNMCMGERPDGFGEAFSRSRVHECGPALARIDDFTSKYGFNRYQPTTEQFFGPADDPRVDLSRLAPGTSDHAAAFTHRSTRVDRVVAESRTFTIATPNETLTAFKNGQTALPIYHPADFTRFSIANKDSHTTRLYARIMAPFYCPRADANQADSDCDAVPDLCDNCPATYNPGQMDMDKNSIGDACPGYNPFTKQTPAEQVHLACPRFVGPIIIDPNPPWWLDTLRPLRGLGSMLNP